MTKARAQGLSRASVDETTWLAVMNLLGPPTACHAFPGRRTEGCHDRRGLAESDDDYSEQTRQTDLASAIPAE